MKKLLTCCALALLPTTAAFAQSAKKPSAAETKNYNTALEEGRKLHLSKDYKGAIKAFEKALTAKPNDPQVLSELGYAAYFDKNYPYALECTQKAIDNSTDKELRGAAYYNLALILEESGKKDKAIDALVTSYTERPNRVVREKLAKLDAAKAAEIDPVAPKTLEGPYKSIDDWCLTKKIVIEEEGAPPYECGADEELTKQAMKSKPSGAYKNLRYVSRNGSEMPEAERFYHLAIQTKKGWYFTKQDIYVYNPGMMGISNELTVNNIEFKELVGGGESELRIDLTLLSVDSDVAGASIYTNQNTFTVLCGFSSAGDPTCTNPILTGNSSETDLSLWDVKELGPMPKVDAPKSWSLDLTITDGQLELKQKNLKGLKSLPSEGKVLLGKRALSF